MLLVTPNSNQRAKANCTNEEGADHQDSNAAKPTRDTIGGARIYRNSLKYLNCLVL